MSGLGLSYPLASFYVSRFIKELILMAGTSRAGSYRTLLATPGVPRTMALANVGRAGYAMLPLLLLFTIADASESFTTAATAMAVFGLTSFTMPIKGRLIDLYGQQRALPVMAGLTGIFLIPIAVTTLLGWLMPAVLLMAFAALAGVTAPPLGPSTRAQWRRIAPDNVDAAYAFDATIEETLWLVGPALAGVLIALIGPAFDLLSVPFTLFIGSTGLAKSPWCPPRSAAVNVASSERGVFVLRNRPLQPVLFLMLGVGTSGSLLMTGIAAVADHREDRALAAVAEVALGTGGVLGGILWGRLNRRPERPRSFVLLLLIAGCADLVIAMTEVSFCAAAALIISGAVSAPLWVLAYQAADEAVPLQQQTEAGTWVTTMSNVGTSVGTAVSGVLVAHAGLTYVLLAPAVVAILTASVPGFM